jgi:hypothetical protein
LALSALHLQEFLVVYAALCAGMPGCAPFIGALLSQACLSEGINKNDNKDDIVVVATWKA